MYTQCPQCFTVYRVDGETLAAARGNVRCIDCETVFDALATLTELGVCRRLTLMPDACDDATAAALRELGCEVQRLDGSVPGAETEADA